MAPHFSAASPVDGAGRQSVVVILQAVIGTRSWMRGLQCPAAPSTAALTLSAEDMDGCGLLPEPAFWAHELGCG